MPKKTKGGDGIHVLEPLEAKPIQRDNPAHPRFAPLNDIEDGMDISGIAQQLLLPLMNGKKLTPARVQKFSEKLNAAMVAMIGPQYAVSLMRGVMEGNTQQMKMFAEQAGLVKGGGPAFSVNIDQRQQILAGSEKTNFESIVRRITANKKELTDYNKSAITAPEQPAIEITAE